MVPTADIVLAQQQLHSDALNSGGYTKVCRLYSGVLKRGVQLEDQIGEGPWGLELEKHRNTGLASSTAHPNSRCTRAVLEGSNSKVKYLAPLPVVSNALVDENDGGQGVPGLNILAGDPV